MNKRETGSRYEDAAAAFLQSKGLRLLEKNFRCRKGEIDLILMDGACLVFTEVKYRSGPGCGSPLEAIDGRKQKKSAIRPLIICISAAFLRIHPAALTQ
ncbi:MAG: YraN family protein [Clostridium sp.]